MQTSFGSLYVYIGRSAEHDTRCCDQDSSWSRISEVSSYAFFTPSPCFALCSMSEVRQALDDEANALQAMRRTGSISALRRLRDDLSFLSVPILRKNVDKELQVAAVVEDEIRGHTRPLSGAATDRSSASSPRRADSVDASTSSASR